MTRIKCISPYFLLFIISLFSIRTIAQTGGFDLFDDGYLHEIKFEQFDTTSFLANKNYQMANVYVDGTLVDSIGVKRKGNISGYPSTNKFPLKIKTNKYVKGKKYDGIKEFTLHMNYQDPSLLREKMTYDICKEMNLHAMRTAFAKVYFNNTYWGIYTIVEGKDELYKQLFDNRDMDAIESLDFGSMCFISNNPSDYDYDQNGGNPTYELENGDATTAWPRFASLIDKANNTPDGTYLATVKQELNIRDFFKYQAINVYLLNFDSYIGFKGNQIYAFDTVPNQWQVIPWDFNASFGLWDSKSPATYPLIPNSVSNGCIASKMNALPELKSYYMDAMCELVHDVAETSKMHAKVDAWDAQIKQAVYDDNRKFITDNNYNDALGTGYLSLFGENIPGMKTFFTERNQFLLQEIQNEGYTCTVSNQDQPSNVIFTNVYPNPSTSTLHINSSEKLESIRIYDLSGKTIRNYSTINSNTSTIEGLEAGSYIVEIQTRTSKENHKIIVL